MLAENLMALASLGGRTVVAAACSDAWEGARRGFARLLGRGDPRQQQLADRRLEETHGQLNGVAGEVPEQVRVALEERWAGRLEDLLEEDPEIAAELRALIGEVEATLPAGGAYAADHALAAGRDVNISAAGGGVAAGVIHGNVAPPGPTVRDPVGGLPGSGSGPSVRAR